MSSLSQPAPLYEKLDDEKREIRLLAIERSREKTSKTRCSLRRYSLDDIPPYYALSYVWGDPMVTESIKVDGVHFAVTTNLMAALQQIRSSQTTDWRHTKILGDLWPEWVAAAVEDYKDASLDPSLLFWIDAICVNQRDLEERASQIQLMKRIFGQARKVVAWLGPEGEDSAKAILVIRLLVREFVEDLGSITEEHVRRVRSGRPDLFSQPSIWKAIRFLGLRKYWQRIWVFQELILAEEIVFMCGSSVLWWEMWFAVNSLGKEIEDSDWTKTPWFRSQFLNSVNTVRVVWREDEKPSDFSFAVLFACRQMDATDLRDKVYGLLGLIDLRIEPDYTLSVSEAYLRTMNELLKQYALGLLLNRAGTVNRRLSQLPSWVVDWSNFVAWIPYLFYHTPSRYKSANPGMFTIDLTDASVLWLSGVEFCLTELVSIDTSHSTEELSTMAPTWNFLYQVLEHQDDECASGIPPFQAFVRMICWDCNPRNAVHMERLDIPSEEFFEAAAIVIQMLCLGASNYADNDFGRDKLITDRLLMNLPKTGLSTDSASIAKFIHLCLGQDDSALCPWNTFGDALTYEPYRNSVFRRMIGLWKSSVTRYSFFYTHNGFVGCGPQSIKNSDAIYLIKGCGIPVVLRKTDSQYELLGTCFIPGLMDEDQDRFIGENTQWERIAIH